VVNFFVFFIHKLLNKQLQIIGFSLHTLLMLEALFNNRLLGFINRKNALNNNNNNILLLYHSYIYV
jgi:hypothetical protein